MTPVTLASDLFAVSQSAVNAGNERCYYCGGKGPQSYRHFEPPVFIGSKNPAGICCPSNHWMCIGCWMWRRKKNTIQFLTEGLKDSQCAMNHSWFVTREAARVIRVSEDTPLIYEKLLHPPLTFFLALLEGEKNLNQLHLCKLNNHPNIQADTVITFTVNNVPHTYTIYELEEALKSEDPGGKQPGVQVLIRLFGPHALNGEDRSKRGRIPKSEGAKVSRVITEEVKLPKPSEARPPKKVPTV